MRSDVCRAAFFCFALTLAACGGGGGGSAHLPVTGPGGSGSGSGSGSGTGQTAQATVSISVHPDVASQADKRAVKYVAPTTKSATFQVVAVNGQSVTGQPVVEQDLVASAPGCTASGATVTCSTSIPVIVGNVTFQVKTYDQTGAQGDQLGTATAGAAIVANQANRIALTVSGIIAQVQLFISPQNQTPGTPGKSLLVVVPQDANGNIIVNPGNYDQPIQLSLSGGTVGTGTTPHVGFEEDGATTPSATATVASPNDQVYVAYDGTQGVGGASIVATVAEATPVSAIVSLNIGSAYLTNTFPQGSYLQNAGFAFTGGNQTGSIYLSGGTPPYSASFTAPGTLSSSRAARAGARGGIHVLQNAAIATAAVSGSTVTITSVAGQYGTATLYVYDSASPANEFTVPISVNAPAIAISPAGCPTGAICTAGSTTFPATATVSQTLTYSGGTGTFTNTFASTGTSSSSCVTTTGTGPSYTFTSTGACSDLLVVTSGNQTAYFAFIQAIGTANYTLASTAHAYSPSTGVVAIAYDGQSTPLANASQATIALTSGNGPWSASPSGCAPYLSVSDAVTSGSSLSNSGFVLALTSNPTAEVTTCSVTFTPTVGTPFSLQVLLYPKMTVSPQQTFDLHAPGDTGSVTVTNFSPGGLTLASNSVEIASQSTTGVLTDLTYSAGTVGFSAGSTTGTAPGTTRAQAGTALVSIHDTNFDEKIGVSVTVDNAYAQTVPTAIGLDYALGGNSATTYTNTTIPSWVASASDLSTSVTFNTGVPYGTLSMTPNGPTSSVLSLSDGAGGIVTIPVTAFEVEFSTYQGSLIGATANEAFPGTGLSDTVTVGGPSGGISVTSSNPSVVAISNVTAGTFTATSMSSGFSTITITDTTTGATFSYTASVTSVSIPILGHGRRSR